MELSMTSFLRSIRIPLMSAILSFCAVTAASAASEQCAQLVQLNAKYRGVTLTAEQKSIKVQMVAWYKENCGHRNRTANR